MGDMKPDKNVKHGIHHDLFWPGVVKSIWEFGPLRITRDRRFKDRMNQDMKTEAWIVSLPNQKHRIGFKYERKV